MPQCLCAIPTQSATQSPVSVLNNSSSEPFHRSWFPGLTMFLQNPTLNVTLGFALPPKEEKEFVNEALVLGMPRFTVLVELLFTYLRHLPGASIISLLFSTYPLTSVSSHFLCPTDS